MVYEIQTIIRLMIETWMIVLWMIVSYPEKELEKKLHYRGGELPELEKKTARIGKI